MNILDLDTLYFAPANAPFISVLHFTVCSYPMDMSPLFISHSSSCSAFIYSGEYAPLSSLLDVHVDQPYEYFLALFLLDYPAFDIYIFYFYLFFSFFLLYQHSPVEFSVVVEMFYICVVQYGNQQLHVAIEHLKYSIWGTKFLIKLNVNNHMWQVATCIGQCSSGNTPPFFSFVALNSVSQPNWSTQIPKILL